MTNKTYRTCQNCGMENLNRDYCQQCDEIININLKRELERRQKALDRRAAEKSIKKNSITIFFETATENKNIFIKLPAQFIYSIWVIVMAIGSFLAWVVSFVVG